jgi:hypothetical protein
MEGALSRKLMTISALHRQARIYAAAGFPIFPCKPGEKVPATKHGFLEATTSLEKVDAWWYECPDYNIGFSPAARGWTVVDLDRPKPGEISGREGWLLAQDIYGPTPPTFTVNTPRDGDHLFYDGATPKSTVRKLLGKEYAIDTRSVGGYVLLPPSQTDDGTYEAVNDLPAAPLPQWIKIALTDADRRVEGTGKVSDDPGDVARASNFLRDQIRRDGAPTAGSRNADTYLRAAVIRDLGLSPASTLAVLADEWNPHLAPPLDDEELFAVVQSAYKYAQNGEGAYAVPSAQEAFQETLKKLPKPAKKQSKFHLEDEDDMEHEPEIEWLVPGLIQKATTVMMVGKPGAFKSFLAIDIALGVASGLKTFGVDPAKGKVVYAALEGRSGIKGKRRKAWRLVRQVQGKIENFFVTKAPRVVLPEECQEFGEVIEKQIGKPDLIIIDTVSKAAAGMDLNKSDEAIKFEGYCRSLVEAFGCTVLCLHHSGKEDGKGPLGSISLEGSFDTTLEVRRPDRRKMAVEVWMTKQKDSEEPERPWTFEMMPIASSLIAQFTTPERHMQLMKGDDPMAPAKVARAIKKLGIPDGASTYLLASELLPPLPNETAVERQRQIKAMVKELNAAAKGALAGFAYVDGKDVFWKVEP